MLPHNLDDMVYVDPAEPTVETGPPVLAPPVRSTYIYFQHDHLKSRVYR